MSEGKFSMVPCGYNDLVNPQSYLPCGGNYLQLCQDCKVVQGMPTFTSPTMCIMTCKCPKLMDNGLIKYYPAIIKYDVKNDKVSTSNDGRLYIH